MPKVKLASGERIVVGSTFEEWNVSMRSAEKHKAEPLGTWWRGPAFPTRAEAVAYVKKERGHSADLSWVVQQFKMVYRIRHREITILAEELL